MILFSWGLCDKMPQTRWLKTTEVYYLTILELRSSKGRCQQGHAPPKVAKEESFLAFFLASDGCQQTWHPWLVAEFQSPSLSTGSSSFMSPPCFQTSLLIRTPVNGFRVPPNPVWPHLNLIISADYFQIKSQSQILRVRTSTYLWGWRVEFKPQHKKIDQSHEESSLNQSKKEPKTLQ